MVAAIASVIVAFLLFKFTNISAMAKVSAEKKKAITGHPGSEVIPDKVLSKTVVKELDQFIEAKQLRQEASKRLVDIFSKELETRIEVTSNELTEKYEGIIEQEKQNEEIAWNKYNKVLTDKKKTEAVIRSIAEGLVVVDAEGKVIMMNPAAEKLLGVAKKHKVGKPISDSLKEEQLVTLVSDSRDGKEDREIELLSQQDETKKTIRASSAVIENENGQTVGMVSVLSDITKQKELDRLKDSFVANVSHELRTPLVAIDKSLSLILGRSAGEITPAQEQFLAIAERNIKRLGLLINDLLDLSKLESGRMKLAPQPLSIDKIIDESISGFNTWAETKSITIKRDIQDGLPQVNIDANRIIQVLNNLIGNAIKFTQNNGNITVTAILDNNEHAVKVSIEDSGIGISEENLTKVFDKFYQAGERISTDISGTGIGLSIAKEIVELHGGRIWAESQKGSGAKFFFTLPLEMTKAGG